MEDTNLHLMDYPVQWCGTDSYLTVKGTKRRDFHIILLMNYFNLKYVTSPMPLALAANPRALWEAEVLSNLSGSSHYGALKAGWESEQSNIGPKSCLVIASLSMLKKCHFHSHGDKGEWKGGKQTYVMLMDVVSLWVSGAGVRIGD